MKRLMIALASVAMAFAFSATASAAVVTYTSSHSWYAGQSAGSSFSSSWFQNGFYKPNPFDATVTFIDNVSYSWHSTRRDASEWTVTHWMSSQVKKAHCRANAAGGYGACTVYS